MTNSDKKALTQKILAANPLRQIVLKTNAPSDVLEMVKRIKDARLAAYQAQRDLEHAESLTFADLENERLEVALIELNQTNVGLFSDAFYALCDKHDVCADDLADLYKDDSSEIEHNEYRAQFHASELA